MRFRLKDPLGRGQEVSDSVKKPVDLSEELCSSEITIADPASVVN
jgi:hypothetical protein